MSRGGGQVEAAKSGQILSGKRCERIMLVVLRPEVELVLFMR